MTSALSANIGPETIAKENAKLQGVDDAPARGGDSGPFGAEPVAAVEPQVWDDRGTGLPQALLSSIPVYHLLIRRQTCWNANFPHMLKTSFASVLTSACRTYEPK